ncbi:MAG: class I SAM-dependent rRNA methyltransferase [Pseudomonadota bacterium]
MPEGAARPVVRLMPKVWERREGAAPWIWADQVVRDRRTRALAPGTIVTVEDAGRVPVATAALNLGSKIGLRLLGPAEMGPVDEAWFAGRLHTALALREALYPAPVYRLVHAEADGLPGVVIDRFGEAAVVQPNAAWAERYEGALLAALVAVTGVETVVLNGVGRARGREGLAERREVLCGPLEGPVPVEMNGATYLADLMGGQKTGLFLDQRETQAFAQRLAPGRRVLDVFCHVGGFALATLVAGAEGAVAVDASAPALALAEGGARASGVAERFAARQGDAFAVMEEMAGAGERFGLVVSDPPAFAPSKEALEAGLRAYRKSARAAARLVAPDGFLIVCSCSHAADLARFRAASLAGVAAARRTARILWTGGAGPDHPVHPALVESGYLKAIAMALD